MEAPEARLSREKFLKTIQKHVDSHYNKSKGESGYECKKCGSKIESTTCFASIHIDGFDCAGVGEVEQHALPYCPQCEGKPKTTSTCIHVPLGLPVSS